MTRRPFPLAVPEELSAYILDFQWDLDLLHALDLPVVSMPVEALRHHLELPFWAYAGKPFQVTPRQVAADPVTYREQYERTLAADFNLPLDALARPDHRITILDGIHRLLRAELEDRSVVEVRLLPWRDLDQIAVPTS
ncbi:hypothetical protein [Kribbella sp. NPDC004875]|uniref:hypothetical protein n=1 Tax=Kribbella sp. NPDC004875 TaxID=3364107 RepID=UPI00368229A6